MAACSSGRKTPPDRGDNLFQILQRQEAEFEALAQSEGAERLLEEGSGYGAYQLWRARWLPRLYPSGDFRLAQRAALAQAAAARIAAADAGSAKTAGATACGAWRELGPSAMPLGASSSRGTGRMHFIAFAESDPKRMISGSPVGGLFQSSDGGMTWSVAGTDGLPIVSAGHGAMAGPNAWFIATGDNNTFESGGWHTSIGIYRTVNAGAAWEPIGLDGAAKPADYQVARLHVPRGAPKVLYAATTAGLYRTDDSFAASVQWNLVLPGRFFDIEPDPGVPGVIYVSGGPAPRAGIYRIDVKAGTATPISDPLLTANVVRVGLAAAPPNHLYAILVYALPPQIPKQCLFSTSHLIRCDTGGGGCVAKGPVTNTGSYVCNWRGVHVTRANALAVSPLDPDVVVVGDVNPARCVTGTSSAPCSWAYASASIHDDILELQYGPDRTTLWSSTDGGIFTSTNNGQSWSPRNQGIATATILRASWSATDPDLYLYGAYDTGSVLLKGNGFRHVNSGDGLKPLIDAFDPAWMYASSQGNSIERSGDGGNSFPVTISNCDKEGQGCNWFTWVIHAGSEGKLLFLAGNDVWRSASRGDAGSWQKISRFKENLPDTAGIWEVYSTPQHADTLFATVVTKNANGVVRQYLYRTSNATATDPATVAWQEVDDGRDLWVTHVEVSDADPDTFWVSYSSYNDAKVARHDATGWHDLTGNLPWYLGATRIVRDRGTGLLYIGTAAGVYINKEDGVWQRFDPEPERPLPNVEVAALDINYVTNRLRAGTFGRGVWETQLADCLPQTTGADAVIADIPEDLGEEPSDGTTTVPESPDIWVRRTADQRFTHGPIPPRYLREHQHESLEYSGETPAPAWVYVKVRNRGTQPTSGRIRLYATEASAASAWPGSWIELSPSAAGQVTALAPGGAWVAAFPWNDIPSPAPATGNVALLARYVSEPDMLDPIVGETSSTYSNVRESNNIATRTVAIAPKATRLTGGKVVFSSDRVQPPQLFLQPVGATTPPVQITHDFFGARHPKWSRDGRYVVYATSDVIVGAPSNTRVDTLAVIHESGAKLLEIPAPKFGAVMLAYPQWSDDGRSIVVLFGHADGARGIGLVRFEAPYAFGNPIVSRPVPADPARPLNPGEPVFSGDGSTIYFAADTSEGSGQLFRVLADGGTPAPVVDAAGVQLRWVFAPSLSPDGSRLLFNSEMWREDPASYQDEEILEYHIATRVVRRVTAEPGHQYGFYAKNGTGEMLVQSNNPASGQYELYLQENAARVPLYVADPQNLWKDSGEWWKPF